MEAAARRKLSQTENLLSVYLRPKETLYFRGNLSAFIHSVCKIAVYTPLNLLIRFFLMLKTFDSNSTLSKANKLLCLYIVICIVYSRFTTSNFSSHSIIFPKKKDPSTHEVTHKMAVEFMKINKELEYWSYSLMRTDKKIHCAKLSSTLDVRSSSHIITVAKDCRKYTALTNQYVQYEFLQVPFGMHVPPLILP